MRIDYTAPQHVRDVIAGLGRSEDVKFSPSNRRLAVAGYRTNKIAVFDVGIEASPDGTKIALTEAAEILSSHLKHPHGLDFIDDETIIVANRGGDVPIFKLPPGELSGRYELEPLEVIGSANGLDAPGSISVTRKDRNLYEALICNNDGNTITRHVLDLSTGCSVKKNDVLLKKWLDIPDGVCASTKMQWIAVSNHVMHNVLLYENNRSLNEKSDPDCILRCVYYPHGLRFTSDGRYILVADAGAPFVHIYRKDGPSWRGLRNPLTSFRVLNEETYLRGRYNPMEGGPKGLDISNDMTVFVTTNECQTLAFFDLAKILEGMSLPRQEAEHSAGIQTSCGSAESDADDQNAYELRYELDVQLDVQDKVNQAKAQGEAPLAELKSSKSWRITAPLRWGGSVLRNLIHSRDEPLS